MANVQNLMPVVQELISKHFYSLIKHITGIEICQPENVSSTVCDRNLQKNIKI